MVKQEYFSSEYLGYINFAFLFFYGIDISCLGQYGDRMNLRVFILAGTFTTSIVFKIIGVMIEIQEKKNYFYSQQLVCYRQKNNSFGLFCCKFQYWNIFGDIYSGSMIGRDHLPLYAPVYLAAVSLLIINFLNVFFLQNAPSANIKKQMLEEYEKNKTNQFKVNNQQLTIAMIEKKIGHNLNTLQEENKNEDVYQPPLKIYQQYEQLNFITAWFVPNVAFSALALVCVKAVYYILISGFLLILIQKMFLMLLGLLLKLIWDLFLEELQCVQMDFILIKELQYFHF
ncbi:unnamed protein product [Paramecium sonneborni]|uniref:Uncharacterized protein n=1 Tax=Paramecium sonneborni TaxID=65129 RepID=A0A8S1RR47_9CILI|nr:unnamed protein product [Paramecium sonneborni]